MHKLIHVTAIALLTAAAAVAANAQKAAQPAVPKGSWGLTTIQPYPHLWGVYGSLNACIAGQKQLRTRALNGLSSMRGVTPDEFSNAVTRLQSLDAATCTQG